MARSPPPTRSCSVLVLAFLTFCISLAEIIASGIVQYLLHVSHRQLRNGMDGWSVTTSSNQLLPPPVVETRTLITGFSAGELAAAIICFASSFFASGWICLSAGRSRRAVRGSYYATASFVTLASIVALGIMAWIFAVTNNQGSIYKIQPTTPVGGVDYAIVDFEWSGDITWERYVCKIATAVHQYEGGSWFTTTCQATVSSLTTHPNLTDKRHSELPDGSWFLCSSYPFFSPLQCG